MPSVRTNILRVGWLVALCVLNVAIATMVRMGFMPGGIVFGLLQIAGGVAYDGPRPLRIFIGALGIAQLLITAEVIVHIANS